MRPIACHAAAPALVVLLAVLSSSCASYTTARSAKLDDVPDAWSRLPYHVAIIPANNSIVTGTDEGNDRNGSPFQFEFDGLTESGGDILTQSLSGTLSKNTFRKVTVLQPPTPSEYAFLGDDLMPTYWVAAAREAQADLLLEVESFTHPVKPKSRAKPLSFLLYLFGPVELLFPDREYSFDGVNLAVSLYDMASVEAPAFSSRAALTQMVESTVRQTAEPEQARTIDEAARFRLAGGAGTLRQFRLTPGDLSYRFGDRLGKSAASASFWTSILIPSALLAKNSSSFSERVTRDAALALGHDLARDIVDGDFEYIVRPSGPRDGLLFDARDATLARSGAMKGVLELRARVRMPSASIDRPAVWVAGREYQILFESSVGVGSLEPLVRSSIENGYAVGMTSPLAGEDEEFRQLLTVYLPDPTALAVSGGGTLPASFPMAQIEAADDAPIDVVQLRLGERLGALGNRARSWTFDLEDIVEPDVLKALQAPRESSDTLRVSDALLEGNDQ